MTDSASFAQLWAMWPDIPEIHFTSSQEAATALGNHSSQPSKPKQGTINSDSLPAHDTGKCRNCGKIAPLICNGCKGLPAAHGNSTTLTRYCAKECQKEHWTTHKKDCKAAKTRQLLYRAANLTKALFYIYSEVTFMWGYVKKVDCSGPVRTVYLDKEKSGGRKSLLVPFSTVTDLVSDEKEQEAYLSYLNCSGTVARFGSLLAARLKGIFLLIEEVAVTVKNLDLKIVLEHLDTGNYSMYHTVLRVTLTSQEQYAVDFTGAQFGHHEECLPWQDYMVARVDQIIAVRPFGTAKKCLAEMALKRPSTQGLVESMKIRFLRELERCIMFWEARGESIDALLALPEEQYVAKKLCFLDFVKTSMKHWGEGSIQHGSWSRK